MKELQKYRVKSAYGVYRKGDIIQPTGMLRDELLMCGRIEKHVEPDPVAVAQPEPAPATTPEPEPVDDIDIDEPDECPLIETATTPEAETAAFTPRRRKPRHAG